MFILDVELLHARLHARRVVPFVFQRLIATHVDVSAGEQIDGFGEYVLQKGEGAFLDIEQGRENAPFLGHGARRLVGHAEFRIRHHGCRGMSGHFDFRHHVDMACGGIGDDVAHLLLCVEAADDARLAGLGIDVRLGRVARGHAPRAHRSELGILFDLQAPGLVIGEMPVQRVHLVQRHPIDELLDVVDRLEIPRGIQHQAAPGETRRVRDGERGHIHADTLRRLGSHDLPQRHAAVEKAGRSRRSNGDAIGGGYQ